MKTAYHYLRFSTKAQKKGYSTERQEELARKCCVEQGWTLSPVSYPDLGISAYRGKHRLAALGVFLEAVKTKKIAKGSILLVESIDRLSREHPGDAWQLFLDVTNAGIDIFVTNLGQLFSRSKPENYPLAAQEFTRANAESKRKSDISAYNWQKKFTGKGVITSRLPCWIRLEEGVMVLDKAKAKVIKFIFEWSVGGMGAYSIAKKLNDQKVPCITGFPKWRQESVNHLLLNKQVIGEFAPSTAKVLPNYFPPVISESLFYRSLEARKTRSKHAGRTPSNDKIHLFAGLLYDAEAVEGTTRKKAGEKYYILKITGRDYMVKKSSKLSGEPSLTVPYESFELLLLSQLWNVEIPEQEDESDLTSTKLAELEINLNKVKARIRKNYSDALAAVAEDLEKEKKELLTDLNKPVVKNLKELMKLDLKDMDDRRVLRQAIRSTVEEIVLSVDGMPKGHSRDIYCVVRYQHFEKHFSMTNNSIRLEQATVKNDGEEY